VPSPSTARETLLDAALHLLEQRGPGALRIRDVAEAAEQSTMGVYTHFGSKQGLLEQLYLHGFRRLEERLDSVARDDRGREALLAFALAYRAFAVDNEALYGLMFERATPDFVPSDASRLAALATFEMLATRVAGWRPDFTDPAGDAHLVWGTMHGLVSIELMHKRWGRAPGHPPAGRSRAPLRDRHRLAPGSTPRPLGCVAHVRHAAVEPARDCL
jgi:AcrR family transcriptional regulator